MPFHKGHLYCVEYAKNYCEKLFVILLYNSNRELDEIQNRRDKYLEPNDRFAHIENACKKFDNVTVKSIDLSKLKDSIGNDDWGKVADIINSECGKIDATFGSEKEYYDYFGKAFPDSKYILIDYERKKVPISGTKIRQMTEKERNKWIV